MKNKPDLMSDLSEKVRLKRALMLNRTTQTMARWKVRHLGRYYYVEYDSSTGKLYPSERSPKRS